MILIVDDDNAIRSSLSLLLKNEGYGVLSAEREGPALKMLNTNPIELVLLDMNFSMETSGKEGIDFLHEIKKKWPFIPVILITAWGSIDLAVEGIKSGAYDFITKPWENQHLLSRVSDCLKLSKNQESVNRSELDEKHDLDFIIGSSPKLVYVLNQIVQVAPTSAPVLICGESGTGKELISEAIHKNSKRKEKPFVKVNVAAIPETLFESEMFGYRKGAFTGAVKDQKGKFETANGGTLFLDEIGELDKSLQVKLLRVIQEKKIIPLGSSQAINIDFRLVCATNKNLHKEIEKGNFREDLFFRINLIEILIPPLRERRADILELIEFFRKMAIKEHGLPEKIFSRSVLEFLSKNKYPGNIRELKNLVERILITSAAEEIELDEVMSITGAEKEGKYSNSTKVFEVQLDLIRKVIANHPDNYSEAARELGLSRGQLYTRMKKYKLGPYKREND